jgi:hypothetical protein
MLQRFLVGIMLSFYLCRAVSADEVGTEYNLGSVPTIFLPAGSRSTLRINSPISQCSGVWSLEVDPQSKIQVSLIESGILMDVPKNAVDMEEITLSIKSTGTSTACPSVKSEKQKIAFVPTYSEGYRYISRERPIPDQKSSRYITVSDVLSVEPVQLNHDYGKARDIVIAGKEIVIDANNKYNSLYAILNEQYNIRSLSLQAEIVTIRSPLRLPQTNVTIYARDLNFEKDDSNSLGLISTVPRDYISSAGPKQEGGRGLEAGNITIFAQKIVSGGSGPRFILNGGQGQQGGPGKKGAPGSSLVSVDKNTKLTDLPSQLITCWSFVNNLKGDPIVYFDFSYMRCVPPIHFGPPISLDINGSWGTRAWPTDGLAGEAAGKPGVGGKGGLLTINSGDEVGSSVGGGASGAKGVPDPAPGGDPGQPAKSSWVLFESYDRDISAWDSVVTSHTALSGSSTPSPAADQPTGPDGATKVLALNAGGWLTPASFAAIVNYIDDLYLSGRTDEVISAAQKYEAIASEIKEKNRDMEVDLLRLRGMRARAESGLDYFGYRPGWVPLQPFSYQLKVYDEQIDKAIRVLYLSHWLKRKLDRNDLKADELKFLVDQTQDSLKTKGAELQKLNLEIDRISNRRALIADEIKVVKEEIGIAEQRIRETAENILKDKEKDSLIGFLKTAATIATVFPVGQPAVGSVGLALNALASVKAEDPIGSYLAIQSGIQKIDPNTLSTITSDINQRLKGMDFKSSQDLTTFLQDNQKQYVELSNAINRIRDAMAGSQAPQSAVDTEIARLKAADASFIALSDKLINLNDLKSEFARDIANLTNQIANVSSGINSSVRAINEVNISRNAILLSTDTSLRGHLEQMQREAQQSLLEVHDLLARAYEYRVLQPYAGIMDLSNLFDRAVVLAESDGAQPLTLANFQELRALYDQSLQRIVTGLWKHLNTTAPEKLQEIMFSFSSQQLKDLSTRKVVSFSMSDELLLNGNMEAYRIADIKVADIDIDRTVLNDRSFANLSISISTDGFGTLKRNDGNFGFFYPGGALWGATVDLLAACPDNPGNPVCIRHSAISPNADSLISTLLRNEAGASEAARRPIERFTPPAASTISLRYDVLPFDLPKPVIKKLKLAITLEALNPFVKEKILAIKTGDDMKPTIAILPEDRAGRVGGRVPMLRYYLDGNSKVTLRAPAVFAEKHFSKWLLPDGKSVDTRDVTIDLMNDSTVVFPVYK